MQVFVNEAREYAKINSNGQLFINPIEVIEKMWEKQGQKSSPKSSNTQNKDNMTQILGQQTQNEQENTELKDNVKQEIARQRENENSREK